MQDIQQPLDYVREDDTTHRYEELPPINFGNMVLKWALVFFVAYLSVIGFAVWTHPAGL